MSSLIDRLRKTKNEPESPSPAEPVAPATPPPEFAGPADEAEGYLRAVSDKMMKLAEDFALGRVNRAQFEELYRHYLDERAAIERLLETQPGTPAWKGAVTEGESVLIKRKHAAQPLGYAVYLNANALPLRSVGDFRVDGATLASMLSAFRSATTEIFGAGLKSSEIEGGRWLCFVPGAHTTLVVLFSLEPARLQLELLEQLHRHFERANQPAFDSGLPDATKLVYPHAAAFE